MERGPDRQEGAESDPIAKKRDLDQVAARGPSQLRLPREGKARSDRARFGSHEAVEGERGVGAGSGGAVAQER
jgi:hypothetical protein